MRRGFRFALALIMALFYTGALAGPTIIRDKRISDLAMTPTLGRGYTIVTNTFQSKCLDNVYITDPSYDFTYKFESISTDNTKHISTMVNFGLKIPVKALSVAGGGGLSVTTDTHETTHHIYVEINMDTYYASVDEARTRLGASAGQLLKNNDLPGFFSSCGSYYVRSLGRNAKFISIYSYTTKTRQRDVSFEADLKADIMSFSSQGVGTASCGGMDNLCSMATGQGAASTLLGGVTGAGGQGAAPAAANPAAGGNTGTPGAGTTAPARQTGQSGASGLSGEAGGSVGVKMSMSQKSAMYKLTIITRAYGLGKNEGATLISYDVPTFKAAVKDAFISMQNPMTGKVTTMEIVPWVENTDFQALIALEKQVIDPQTQRTMLLYKKKQILNGNAEFLAEIERHDRNLMNIYYKSKICKQTIEANWMKDKDTIQPEYRNLEIGNNRFPLKKIRLDKLIKDHLKDEQIEKLIKDEETFMYGANGANVCIGKLLESGMFIKSYRDISECKRLRGKLSAVMNDVIDNYCMPEVAKKVITDAPQRGATSSPTTP